MSICAMGTEESMVKEELGRQSLGDSSSTTSILSPGLLLLVGFFLYGLNTCSSVHIPPSAG